MMNFEDQIDLVRYFNLVKCNLNKLTTMGLAVKRFTSLAVNRSINLAVKRFISLPVEQAMTLGGIQWSIS